MSYPNTTPTYRVPYWSGRSSAQGNRRAALIVDQQLKGAARLLGQNGIISEGTYTSTFVTGASTVVLASSGSYAMEAIIGGVYINYTPTLSWLALPNSSTIYLYVSSQESGIYTNAEVSSLAYGHCVTSWNTNGVTPADSLLVGIATTTGAAITLNTSTAISDSTFSSRPVIQPYAQASLSWQNVTSATQQMQPNIGYVNNNSGVTVFSLPSPAPLGTVNEIVSPAVGRWQINCSASQSITLQSGLTTSSLSGLLASIQRDTSVRIVCTTTSTAWEVASLNGPLVIG